MRHAKNREEPFPQVTDTVARELEAIIKLYVVVHACSCIHDGILNAEVLHHSRALLFLPWLLLLSQMHGGGVNYSEDSVALFRNHETEDAVYAEVKVVDLVSLLIHAHIVSFEARAQL